MKQLTGEKSRLHSQPPWEVPVGGFGGGSWFKRLIYKRGCQEHFSPSAGCAGLFRDIQPLSPWKTLVWCPAPGLFHRSSCIFFSSDDADQFRNASSRAVVWWQPWIYLRLVA